MIALDSGQLETVKKILQRHVPERRVLAFGSRVTGQNKPFSDLDLAVIGDEPLPLSVSGGLRDAFSSSGLPFSVDFVDWAITDEEFRQAILQAHEVIQAGPS